MKGRACAAAFVAGNCVVHGLPALPPAGVVPGGLLALAALTLLVWLMVFARKTRLHLLSDRFAQAFCSPMCKCHASATPSIGHSANGSQPGVIWIRPSLASHAANRVAMASLLLLWPAALGFSFTAWQAQARLAEVLDPIHDDRVSRVTLQVVTLPRVDEERVQFEARVIAAKPEGVPPRILVSWPAPRNRGDATSAGAAESKRPEASALAASVLPGQVWRMALLLRRPWSGRNPHGFDYEGHLFSRSLRATATVRGRPVLLDDKPWSGLDVIAERARHGVRAAMLPHLDGQRYGGVLLALAIGDQASVHTGDWQVFNRSGITHLVSISGSHITMLAALAGIAALQAGKRLRWGGRALGERIPAQLLGAWSALLVAWLYCLLAGWGVPARRTFLMLAIVAGAYLMRLPITGSRVLALAAVAVVAMDPWAVLASGFWLSFGAVCVLLAGAQWGGMRIGHERPARWRRWSRAILAASHLQLVISLALMPALAVKFHEVSLVSPIVNAYAIPLIGLVVTPLSLLCAGASIIPGAQALASMFAGLGHTVLQGLMAPTAWLASLPAASVAVAAAPAWAVALALAGIAWAMVPRGPPLRHAAWLLLAPALCWRPDRPAHGGWRLDALDVGQAGAIVVQTARHTLLFDTGGRQGAQADDGARVIVPFLRAAGIRRLDYLVVSHGDSDHTGGLQSVLQAIPVAQSYASFHLSDFLPGAAVLSQSVQRSPPIVPLEPQSGIARLPARQSACARGVRWTVDGVHFAFLWPEPGASIHLFHDDSRGGAEPGTQNARARSTEHKSWAQQPPHERYAERRGKIQRQRGGEGTGAGRPVHDGQPLRNKPGVVPYRGRQHARHQRNAQSCVLAIMGEHHSALLTGDIGERQEARLLAAGLGPSDIVMAPHHGSSSSSSPGLVSATRPRHVIAQAGRWSRHGHPSPAVQRRWEQAGARFWRSDRDGAVTIRSAGGTLLAISERKRDARYWNTLMPPKP